MKIRIELRKVFSLAVCFVLIFAMSSCASPKTKHIQNSASEFIELRDYIVFTYTRTTTPVAYNKQTEDWEVFQYDPINTAEGGIPYRYYCREDDHTVAMTTGSRAYSICRVDMDTFYWTEDLGLLSRGVYESYLGAEDLFSGLRDLMENTETILGMFSYNGDYLIWRYSGVFSLDGDRRAQEVCIHEEESISAGNAAFDGQTFYFLRENQELAAVNVDTGDCVTLKTEVNNFRLTEQGLLIHYRDGKLVLCAADGSDERELVAQAKKLFDTSNKYVFYGVASEDGRGTALHRMTWDMSEDVELLQGESVNSLSVIRDPEWLFYYTQYGLHRCDHNGENVVAVSFEEAQQALTGK